MSNLDTILSALRGMGLSAAQAAGVAGNWQIESGFDPTAHNDREGAIGIGQWEGGRRAALDAYAKQTGGSETDLNTQLGFARSEFQGSESAAFQRLLATNDPGSAAAVVDQFYERSSGSARATRIAAAQQIAAGNPSTGGPTGDNTATAAPAGVFSALTGGWQSDVLSIALKVGAGCTAAALIVLGVTHTVKAGA